MLASLVSLINTWHVEHAISAKKISKQEAESRKAYILPFGSFEMRVHFPDTDMDLICVFPSYISQDDFFQHFKNKLYDLEDAKEIIDVVDARVPILKLRYKGY